MRIRKAKRRKSLSSTAFPHWRNDPSDEDMAEFRTVKQGLVAHVSGGRFTFYDSNYTVDI